MSHRPLYQLSTRALVEKIQRLRLEKGDIVVVSHPDAARALESLGKITDFPVPVVVIPDPRGLQVLKREDLLNLLEQLEQADAVSVAGPGGEATTELV